MKSKEALEKITDWIEYFTRLDYVDPIVRGEVQKNFYDAYHKTRPELELIKKDLEILEILKPLIEIIPNSTTDALSIYDIRIKPLHIIDDKILLEIKEWLENDNE